ncbi:hypothetical protein BDV33DRAFT_230152 [Aspergillus novoparasiticus]|uniref:Peptidase M3A/M3B catalytic domain-containing protein n=1 Tax=Aspergillus novoparasiticus TaxID=986946 RepID=A0A5N6E6D9_9EURO|nr:hypothetical protein BDV33DRAFT_230152 [Aspergillus novoparasiticus]
MSEPATCICPIPRLDISAEGLEEQAKDLISHTEQATARLISSCRDNTSVNFETIIVPLAHTDNRVKARVQYIALFQAISPSPDVRKASSRAISLVDRAYLKIFQNEKLLTLVCRVRKNNSSTNNRSEEDVRLLSKFHWKFIENGMHLTGPSRDRFTWISHRLIELRVKFMETLGLDPGCLWKNKQQLAGVPLNKLSAGAGEHDREGLYRIPLKRPITNLILAECRVPDTRREAYLHFREIVVLRDEAARLLGFPSFAVQKLTQQMLGSPGRVNDFLELLQNALKPLVEKEIAKLHELADNEGPIHLWDFDFYHTRILQEQNNVDHEYISQWFPARVTVERMLGLYGELFGLRFEKEQDSALIGYLYTDIFPRAGTYNHAANFNIYPSFLDTDGKQAPVVTALVCNVPQAEPALLRHAKVVSIFHELGHGIHDLVGKSRYATFHGHRTVTDFTEAPSQLLEYWCWTPECLRQLSCHYSYVSPELYSHWLGGREVRNATQPPMELPLVLAQNLGATKQLNQGILTLRQVASSKFDMQVHNPDFHHDIERMHIPEVYNSLLETTTGLSGPAIEAGYYSYLYTRTLAADIWSSRFKDSPMSRQAAKRYRQQILNHGGIPGEAPTSDTYLQDLGCKVLTTSV